MLRDTVVDVQAGYFNVPREVLEAFSIGPGDVRCDAYRAWVRDRVALARANFDAGKLYFTGVPSRRHRLAGLLYIARFEWLIDLLERNDFTLQEQYERPRRLATGVRIGRSLVASLGGPRMLSDSPAQPSFTRGSHV
jgi:phytoene/squalene synthetase